LIQKDELLLDVHGLNVSFQLENCRLQAVSDVSFKVRRGETLAIVGESGSGKSVTSLALMGLLPRKANMAAERMEFQGASLVGMAQREISNLRGNRFSMIFQEPMTALNPAYTIGNQLIEVMLRHRKVSKRAATERAMFLLEKVGMTSPGERLRQYPHQLSGGLRQRVVIAMALMCGPDLLIADEPTTALDVSVQAQILRLLKDLQEEFQSAMILITHDLSVVARVADTVAVMYAGTIVESAPVRELFASPYHPYTQGLLSCLPVPGKVKRGDPLGTIPGIVPSVIQGEVGCQFADRCPRVTSECRTENIAMQKAGSTLFRCRLPASVLAQPVMEESS